MVEQINFDPYLRFLKSFLDEIVVEARYEPYIGMLSLEEKIEIIDAIDSGIAKLKNSKENIKRLYGIILEKFYFDAEVNYNYDNLARDVKIITKMSKSVSELGALKKDALYVLKRQDTGFIRKKLDTIVSKYNVSLRTYLKREKKPYHFIFLPKA